MNKHEIFNDLRSWILDSWENVSNIGLFSICGIIILFLLMILQEHVGSSIHHFLSSILPFEIVTKIILIFWLILSLLSFATLILLLIWLASFLIGWFGDKRYELIEKIHDLSDFRYSLSEKRRVISYFKLSEIDSNGNLTPKSKQYNQLLKTFIFDIRGDFYLLRCPLPKNHDDEVLLREILPVIRNHIAKTQWTFTFPNFEYIDYQKQFVVEGVKKKTRD